MRDAHEPARPETLDRWFARGAVVVVMALQFTLINDWAYGTRWLAPVLELILLASLIVLTFRGEPLRLIRLLEIALLAVISLFNARALLLLLRALLAGTAANGRSLLIDATNIWAINVIVFSLWYWELDRQRRPSEFIFPRMTLPDATVGTAAIPGFVDYLFLSFNTSTAFSPTDTMPLTARMKLLMMLQAGVSLLTLALVAARAVNILA